MRGRVVRVARFLSCSLTVLFVGIVFGPEGIAAQDMCPAVSGPEAEAGWRAYRGNEIERARRHFEAALSRCEDAQYARTGLAYVTLREGDEQGAIAMWTVVVAAEPNNVDALVGMGLAAWRLGDLESVREYFEHVLEVVPDHPTALDYLGRLSAAELDAAASEENAAPEEDITPVPEATPVESVPAVDPADQAWADGETDVAFRLYSARLEQNPADELATLRVGLIHGWREEYEMAMGLLTRLIERNPNRLDARVARARVLAWSGDLLAAREEVLQVLLMEPDDFEANEALLEFDTWVTAPEDAGTSFEGLMSISPDASDGILDKGITPEGGVAVSRAGYDALLVLNPNDLDARLGLARVLAFSRDFEESIAEYEEVLRLSPSDARAVTGMARTLGWAGRMEEGRATARRAVDLDESNAEAWVVLGQVYRWSGQNMDAKRAFTVAAELEPNNAEIRDQLRAVRLVLAPVAAPTLIIEDDSDGNRMVTTLVTSRWRPLPRTTVRARAYYKDLEQGLGEFGVIQSTAQGFIVSVAHTLRREWTVTGAIGGDDTDAPSNPSFLAYRLAVATPDRRSLRFGLDLSSSGLTETAALAQRGVRSTGIVISGRWLPAPGWRVDGNIGLGRYEGTENNSRRSGFLGASKRIGREFTVGASFRGFSFQKNLFDGYFDPDFYGIAELTGAWVRQLSLWTFRAELAPGIQKVTRAGESGRAIRASGRAGYRLGAAREVSLSYTYSSAGLTRLSNGASSYSYSGLTLGLGWAF
jgi:tetratricopeptide (TPR) repeat protein